MPIETPWGPSQAQKVLAPGIIFHSTASHGGIELDTAHQAKLTQYQKGNWLGSLKWWEEDCDWAVPYFIFRDEIEKHAGLKEHALHDAEKLFKSFVERSKG